MMNSPEMQAAAQQMMSNPAMQQMVQQHMATPQGRQQLQAVLEQNPMYRRCAVCTAGCTTAGRTGRQAGRQAAALQADADQLRGSPRSLFTCRPHSLLAC
jgi:heterodisulfide reductase subunit C